MTAAKKDPSAPETLVLELRTPSGETWGTITAAAKEFKTGSVGFYATGKVSNPKGGASYQVGANIVLIGSKGGGAFSLVGPRSCVIQSAFTSYSGNARFPVIGKRRYTQSVDHASVQS
jgi:hypothetical protein